MHPMLLTTPDGVKLARERVLQEEWARNLLKCLADEAQAFASEPLPGFDCDWWREASTKPWQSIYPEVAEHTYFGVVKPCVKTWNAAVAYAATGDERLAELVQKVLLHYTNYEFAAVHPDVGMNWSIWLMRLLQAYDLIRNTVCPDGAAKIDALFDSGLAAVRKNDEWWLRDNMGGLFNNHFAWHKLFIGSCGIFYGRPELVDYAINADQGMRELIENGSRDDGLWFESSINYHFAAVVPLVEMARQLRNSRSAPDLWSQQFANGRCLTDLVTGPIHTLFPDKTLPTIGDCYAHRATIAKSDIYYAAYDAYGSPELAWALDGRTDPPADALFLRRLPHQAAPPSMSTRIWPEHGYVGLRTEEGTDYWNGHGFSVFLSRDLDSVHSHRDKFGLMVFGRGKHLAVDVEAESTAPHAFSSRVMSELNRSTVCHNTVMVDGLDHTAIATKLDIEQFINRPDLKMATIADERGLIYAGVRMRRTVAATPDYVLDVFQVASETEHTYDYLFHTLSDQPDLRIDGDFQPFQLPDEPPWKWLKNSGSTVKEGDWHADAKQNDLHARLNVLGCPNTRVIVCRFPAKDDFSGQPAPMLIARRRARTTFYVALLQAKEASVPEIDMKAIDDRHNVLRISVVSEGKVRDFSVRKL